MYDLGRAGTPYMYNIFNKIVKEKREEGFVLK